MRGLFLEPIDNVIQQELVRRRKILSAANRSKSATTGTSFEWEEYFGKTPWIKIVSNAMIKKADGSYDDQIRLNHILQSGVVDPNALIPGTLAQTVDLYRPDMRMTPLPALTRLTVETKGKLGSIKEAKFTFTVYHEDDLDLYEQLYMVPGVTLCVEYGWSIYQGVTIGQDPSLVSKDDYAKAIIDGVFNSDGPGRYDGLLGIVKNFNYSVQPDGSYECSVEATSPNSILMGLTNQDSDRYPKYEMVMENQDGEPGQVRPVRPTSMIYRILRKGGLTKDDLDGTGILKYNIYDTAAAAPKEGTGKTILANAGIKADGDSLPHWMKVKRGDEKYKYYHIVEREENKYKVNGTDYGAVTGEESAVIGFETLFSGESKSTTYVSYGFVEDIIVNKFMTPLAVNDNGDNKGIATFASIVPESDGSGGIASLEGVKIANPKGLISCDPKICILPGQQNIFTNDNDAKALAEEEFNKTYLSEKQKKAYKKARQKAPKFKDEAHYRHINTPGDFARFQEKDVKSRLQQDGKGETLNAFDAGDNKGYLRNIMINLDVVERALQSVRDDEKVNAVQSFLISILNNVNSACGGVWDFVVRTVDEGIWPRCTVMDASESEDVEVSDGPSEQFQDVFDLGGLSKFTLLQSMTMQSKIPNGMKAMAYLGAVSKLSDGGQAKKTFGQSAYSNSVVDRLTQSSDIASDIEEQEKSVETDPQGNPTGDAESAKTRMILSHWVHTGGDETAISDTKEALKEYVLQEESTGNGHYKAPILAMEGDFTLEGISGIFIGAAVTSKHGLPKRNQDRVAFQVMGVSHNIDGKTWTTQLRGMMRIVS